MKRSIFVAFLGGSFAIACAVSEVPHGDDAAMPDATVPDATVPDATVPDELRQALATVVLSPIGASALSGNATLIATRGGVDLALTLQGCSGSDAKPVRILEARSCDEITATSETLDGARGEGIPGLLCLIPTGSEGRLMYTRAADVATRWAIGDGSPEDLVGHAMALFDPQTRAPIACGVIELGEERVLVALPPEGERPSVKTLATIAGMCLWRTSPTADCSDPVAVSDCANEHCQLGACLAQCADYVGCIDAQQDSCMPSSHCPTTPECGICLNDLAECSLSFCSAELTCPVIPTQGGACSSLFACATLQGAKAASYLAGNVLRATLGGEPTCIQGLSDTEIITHYPVPCDASKAFDEALGAAPGSRPGIPLEGPPCASQADCTDGQCVGAVRIAGLESIGRCLEREETPQLGDGVVGRACADDAACDGASCEIWTALRTPFPEGYCTGRCYEDATCGASGACILPLGSSEPGHCYQRCEDDAGCPRDDYRCMPLGDGARTLDVCYPRADALPDHFAGAACEDDAACADGAGECRNALALPYQMLEITAPDGYCSAPCLFDADCGAGAQCITGGVSGGHCMSICDDETPCRDGYECLAHLRDPSALEATVCMPRLEQSP